MSKYDLRQIIFKCCVSQMYLIVLLPNRKRTYDQICLIREKIRALYRELVLFLRLINGFCYIPENEIEGGDLGWNKSQAHRTGSPGPTLGKWIVGTNNSRITPCMYPYVKCTIPGKWIKLLLFLKSVSHFYIHKHTRRLWDANIIGHQFIYLWVPQMCVLRTQATIDI